MARKKTARAKTKKNQNMRTSVLLYVQERARLLNNPCAEFSNLKRKLKALLNLEKASLKKH